MIVIDEFRMLAEEQPEALAHLLRIAAVGRSLGVHLVLATQRPGGIVSADIRANVNLRIALRVRDRSDSDDVIGCPDAADLPESAPGRALASTGGGPARAFQTGRIAGHAADSEGPLLLRRPGRPWPVAPPQHASGPSDLERLTATLTQLAARLDVPPPHRPWLPPLPDELTDTQLPSGETGAGAPFALMDLPTEQRQVAAEWSPATGHWMVVGAPGSGRTTALAAVVHAAARRWSPDRLQVQVIGDGSATTTTLSGLDHVGSVVDGEDTTVVGRFLERLEADISDRRRLLRASGHATLDAWWSAHDSAGGPTPPPHLLLAVDGWGRVTRPRGASDLGETAESLETLMRDGTSAGLCVLVAGGRELLSGRVSSLVASRLVLHLGDRGDAALAGLTRTQVSERLVPGRARWQPGGHLVQVARPASPRRAPCCADHSPVDRVRTARRGAARRPAARRPGDGPGGPRRLGSRPRAVAHRRCAPIPRLRPGPQRPVDGTRHAGRAAPLRRPAARRPRLPGARRRPRLPHPRARRPRRARHPASAAPRPGGRRRRPRATRGHLRRRRRARDRATPGSRPRAPHRVDDDPNGRRSGPRTRRRPRPRAHRAAAPATRAVRR
ncbi:putative cell division-related protein [Janibacter hoylei PVAS-1]|uniref:Putative cell division-related protein n=1 Tax=Janibacter hoylei PVAS-1 TaxID=1210046 RepID=K1EA78_9MICO|nr:putative cell division-related protein [Janibacter hoylei PVAS-1]